jgi:hypothetical protein
MLTVVHVDGQRQPEGFLRVLVYISLISLQAIIQTPWKRLICSVTELILFPSHNSSFQ